MDLTCNTNTKLNITIGLTNSRSYCNSDNVCGLMLAYCISHRIYHCPGFFKYNFPNFQFTVALFTNAYFCCRNFRFPFFPGLRRCCLFSCVAFSVAQFSGFPFFRCPIFPWIDSRTRMTATITKKWTSKADKLVCPSTNNLTSNK